MERVWRWIVVLASVMAPAIMAGQADAARTRALDPGDSISLTAPVAATAVLYSGHTFTFSGAGAVDGDPDGYAIEVLFTPYARPAPPLVCPANYWTTFRLIEYGDGGPANVLEFETTGAGDLTPGAGPYAYTATVNPNGAANVIATGGFVACAYLIDGKDPLTTLAVSPPVTFTLVKPPGPARPSFGGSPGRAARPPDQTLTVTAEHPPILAPGINRLTVAGRLDAAGGPAALVLTIKPSARFDGCAATAQQDLGVTRTVGGNVLSFGAPVTAGRAGRFRATWRLQFKQTRQVAYVVCAYLVQGAVAVAVGDDRFVPVAPAAKPK